MDGLVGDHRVPCDVRLLNGTKSSRIKRGGELAYPGMESSLPRTRPPASFSVA
ncbi:hypothetical protein CSKR_201239 [Clonorchis sinensis]|uniref:Uncharacterized protein n=1 Tax=Clonorchis sinensis TaxID=79923 RepID=A0A8T1MNK2_CLOSI|nr:hypothetical protein CSKR_201239 [Clonorchis sinensis]